MGSIQPISENTLVKVLIIGGSYGGLTAALNLLDLCRGKPKGRTTSEPIDLPETPVRTPIQIKIVDERDDHLIGSPLALASKEYAKKAWTRFQDIPALQVPEITFVQGTVLRLDTARKMASFLDSSSKVEVEEKYDYLVAASGLRRAWPVVPQSYARNEYLDEVGRHIEAVKSSVEGVVVIGGGAVGIEMAAEIKAVEPSLKVTLIHSREKLLSSEPLPDDFRDQTLKVLQQGGVDNIMGQRVIDTKRLESDEGTPLFELTLSNGDVVKAGHVITAISKSVPSTAYLPRETLDEDNLVKIQASLQFKSEIDNAVQHFAVGDIASWSGIKRCGAAMHMGHHAAINIHQLILEEQIGKEPKFLHLAEVPPMIALAVGEQAVTYDPENGITSGKDVMKVYFGDDLGFSICWNYLHLSLFDDPTREVSEK